MQKKPLPCSYDVLQKIAREYQTPFYLYDAKGIRASCKILYKNFKNLNYKNYFAVKALPNPNILKIVNEEGMGLDCSSMAELLLAEKLSIKGNEITFTSN